MNRCDLVVLCLLSHCLLHATAAETAGYADLHPQRYDLTARASEIDSRTREHPEVSFVFEQDGEVQDRQHACVDTREPPRERLVIWLMDYRQGLFRRLCGYGLHAIQVHYANRWFSALNREPPPDPLYLGRIRLEAATGEDVSEAIDIPRPDGIEERARQFVLWLSKQNPQGGWQMFLTEDESDLRWERVILAGISHGATTAARFAKHQQVDRVVMFSGPRDQRERWQELPSATPSNRYFGFTHVLDGGWTADHYCRSWQLLGLHAYGPVVDVDAATPPYDNSRRLVSHADVAQDAGRAHGAVIPGNASVVDSDGNFLYEPVWRYLFTHPVDEVGVPVPLSTDCRMQLAD